MMRFPREFAVRLANTLKETPVTEITDLMRCYGFRPHETCVGNRLKEAVETLSEEEFSSRLQGGLPPCDLSPLEGMLLLLAARLYEGGERSTNEQEENNAKDQRV